MPNFNKVILMGHLTRDPELSYTTNQTAICKFGLAVNHKFGEREEVCFVDITAWGKQGEVVQKYCHKGDALLVEGRLTLDRWQDKDGQNRSKLYVTMSAMSFVGKGGERQEPKPQPTPKPTEKDFAPFGEPPPKCDGSAYDPNNFDEIPF